RRPIHYRGEAAAIEELTMAALLHALDDEDVLFEDGLPQTCIFRTHLVELRRLRGFDCVIKLDVFNCPLAMLRLKHDVEVVNSLHAEYVYMIMATVLGPLVPLFV